MNMVGLTKSSKLQENVNGVIFFCSSNFLEPVTSFFQV